jgi:pyridoxine kinase
MPLALILSSFVAASRIGGAAQQYVLAQHRIDPVLAPTVLLGRSPAKGAEGQVTPPDVLRRMLADIEADAVFGMLDLVITGYFSSAEQVEIAAGVLERMRDAESRRPVLVVDPILGDAPGGLYVKPEVAAAIAARLVPLADWITPNAWELSHLSGRPVDTAAEALAAAQALGKPTLLTSAPSPPGLTGMMLIEGGQAIHFTHPYSPAAPKGTGDLVTASFGAAIVEGMTPAAAAEHAARAAAEIVKAGADWGASELPIVALGDRLVRPAAHVLIEPL